MKYNQYSKYKDSGLEWIGEIPEHWEVQRLKISIKGITEFASNGSFAGLKENVTYQYSPNFARLVRLTDIRSNFPKNHGLWINEYSYNFLKKSKLFGDEIIVANVGAGSGQFFKMPRIEERASLAPNMMIINFDITKIDRDFILLCLNSDYIQSPLKISATVSSAQPKLNKTDIKNILLVFPPKEEQKQIYDFTQKGTTHLDVLISKSQSQINLLQEKRQATINQAVTKGLDPSVKMKDSGVEWIGDIPEAWGIQRLNHLKKEGTSITYGIVQPGPDVEDGVPYIQATDMKGIFSPKQNFKKTSQAIANQYSRSQVHEGDIVMAIRATIGNAMIIPDFLDGANIDRGPAKISPGNNINRRFLLYYLNSLTTQQYVKSELLGATITGITLALLRKLIVPCPTKEEQDQISEFLDKQTTKFDDLIAKSKTQITLLEEKKQALITAAVTGKIDVRGEIAV